MSDGRDALDRYLDRAVEELMADVKATEAILRNALADGAYLEVTAEWDSEDLMNAGEGTHGTFDVWAPVLTEEERRDLADYWCMYLYEGADGSLHVRGDEDEED